MPYVQRRARPVLACGKRAVPQQLHPWMIGRHPAWPGLEPVAADGQSLVLQASDNGLQCCAGLRGRHRRPVAVDRQVASRPLWWPVAVGGHGALGLRR